ncbi:MAG: glutathione S-transferase family protein [Alphaproteobacteria bacterium HGW-Alphaproteobacteria-11]|nr:MAG: glutathione S-transferase family protein [Alphaproteobacteria bacterium HGW-Alphaproteobacteria-11]
MTDIVFHSQPLSVYLWTASLVAAEKGVSWSVNPVEPGSEAHLALNPFAKSPVLQHGQTRLYETLAIAHYIDRTFDGPALQPADVPGQAQVLRWASLVNAYIFPTLTNGIAKERLLVPMQGGVADEARVAQAVKDGEMQLGVVARDLEAHAFLAGDEISIADCFLLPHLHFVSMTPEGAALIAAAPKVSAWLEAMRARPSFAATDQLARRAA